MLMGNSLKCPPQLSMLHQRKERNSRMPVHGCKRMKMTLSLMYIANIVSSTNNSPSPRTFTGNSKPICSLEYFSRKLGLRIGTCLTWPLRATTEYIDTGHYKSTIPPMICSDALMSSTFEHDQT